jgi:hypothetical protein
VYVASLNGKEEAVRALLGAGAVLNQVAVSVYGRAEERGVFVCGVRCVCEGREGRVFVLVSM